MISPQYRSALFLTVVALAALAASLILAFAFAPPERPGAHDEGALPKTTERRSSPRAPGTTEPAARSRPLPSLVDKPPLLWTLLTPWALRVDAIAVLGMVAVLALRHGIRRRKARI